MYGNLNQKHSHIGNTVPDMVDVILDTAHQLAGAGPVKEIGGKALDVVEQLLTHIGCDGGAGHVKGVFLDVAEDKAADTDGKKAKENTFQGGKVAVPDNIINDAFGKLR